MLTRQDIVTRLSELKPELQRDFSVTGIGVFGSFADNSQTMCSDIDLVVEFAHPIGWKYFTLEKYLEGIFGRKVDIVTKAALKEQIKDQILQATIFIE
jgi:predicted nucleotidyltransferase